MRPSPVPGPHRVARRVQLDQEGVVLARGGRRGHGGRRGAGVDVDRAGEVATEVDVARRVHAHAIAQGGVQLARDVTGVADDLPPHHGSRRVQLGDEGVGAAVGVVQRRDLGGAVVVEVHRPLEPAGHVHVARRVDGAVLEVVVAVGIHQRRPHQGPGRVQLGHQRRMLAVRRLRGRDAVVVVGIDVSVAPQAAAGVDVPRRVDMDVAEVAVVVAAERDVRTVRRRPGLRRRGSGAGRQRRHRRQHPDGHHGPQPPQTGCGHDAPTWSRTVRHSSYPATLSLLLPLLLPVLF